MGYCVFSNNLRPYPDGLLRFSWIRKDLLFMKKTELLLSVGCAQHCISTHSRDWSWAAIPDTSHLTGVVLFLGRRLGGRQTICHHVIFYRWAWNVECNLLSFSSCQCICFLAASTFFTYLFYLFFRWPTKRRSQLVKSMLQSHLTREHWMGKKRLFSGVCCSINGNYARLWILLKGWTLSPYLFIGGLFPRPRRMTPMMRLPNMMVGT